MKYFLIVLLALFTFSGTAASQTFKPNEVVYSRFFCNSEEPFVKITSLKTAIEVSAHMNSFIKNKQCIFSKVHIKTKLVSFIKTLKDNPDPDNDIVEIWMVEYGMFVAMVPKDAKHSLGNDI